MKKQYLLCFIKHYAENIESETFTSKEISEFLSGFVTSNSITSVLKRVNLLPKETSLYNPHGAPISV